MKITKDDLLPFDENQKDTCITTGGCSLVGDFRGDENIALHSMHTLWLREHNRIAKQLKKLNKKFKGNKIYHETRKIVGAILQRIVFMEYVPIVARLNPYRGFDQKADPSIINAFATAAFRYGHSLVPEFFSQLSKDFKKLFEPKRLQEVFFNRQPVNEFGIEPTMFGLVGNESNTVDTGFCNSLGRKLLIKPGDNDNADLAAFNIQRGRDHGLPTYGKWREYCKLKPVKNWKDLRRYMPSEVVEAFMKIYNTPDDIDLYPAGISENHVKYTNRHGKRRELAVGPTFECIFKKQFSALRDGDRFFYQTSGLFTPKQFREIKKITLSSVLCANLKGITSLQRNAFFAANNRNRRVICDRIPQLDLKAWQRVPRRPRQNKVNNKGKNGKSKGKGAKSRGRNSKKESNIVLDEIDLEENVSEDKFDSENASENEIDSENVDPDDLVYVDDLDDSEIDDYDDGSVPESQQQSDGPDENLEIDESEVDTLEEKQMKR